jgi:uncharacterized protein YndB with AHSA1/START domain
MTPTPDAAGREIVSSRTFPHPPAVVFAAFTDPAVLARWWGPAGFTTTIDVFDPRPGGIWRCVMRGPDGTDYHNVSVFDEVTTPERVVFRHLEPVHRFRMEMTFAPAGAGTQLTWRMTFDSTAEADRVRAVILAANEQNFDRLAAVLAG